MTSFFRENWFWRGTQSAIFYYASCAPVVDYKYKRKRRNEAARAEKQRSEVISTQPGAIRQPGAFQTNEGWVEEIVTGPGPPKGWKTDPIIHKLTSREKDEIRQRCDQLDGPVEQYPKPVIIPNAKEPETGYFVERPEGCSKPSISIALPSNVQRNKSISTTLPERTSNDTSTSGSSETEELPLPQSARPRLSMERRLSSAVDNIRDTLRSTINLEGWNWKRYNREDEILSGFNQRVTKMWDKATNFSIPGTGEIDGKASASRSRKRAATNESDRYDYQKYGRNPEINDLHPPAVSRLPITRDDAAWMLLPAPSAAVMEGKSRPQDEPALRWPLAQIGRNAQEWQDLKLYQETVENRTRSGSDVATESTPDLSDSVSEGNTSEEDIDWRPALLKRHSAPVAGWVPVKTTTRDFLYMTPSREA